MPYDSEQFAIMESVIDIINNVPSIPAAVKARIRSKMRTR